MFFFVCLFLSFFEMLPFNHLWLRWVAECCCGSRMGSFLYRGHRSFFVSPNTHLSLWISLHQNSALKINPWFFAFLCIADSCLAYMCRLLYLQPGVMSRKNTHVLQLHRQRDQYLKYSTGRCVCVCVCTLQRATWRAIFVSPYLIISECLNCMLFLSGYVCCLPLLSS